EHAEVGYDATDLVEPRRLGAEVGGAVVADPAHRVDALDEDVGRMVGHPVAGDVVDRVAGRATEAEQHRLRHGVVADGGDVLVAVPVDLARTHHHVPPSRPADVEHRPAGGPRL